MSDESKPETAPVKSSEESKRTNDSENADAAKAKQDDEADAKADAEAAAEEARKKKEASEELTMRLQKLALERQKVSLTSVCCRQSVSTTTLFLFSSLYHVWDRFS